MGRGISPWSPSTHQRDFSTPSAECVRGTPLEMTAQGKQTPLKPELYSICLHESKVLADRHLRSCLVFCPAMASHRVSGEDNLARIKAIVKRIGLVFWSVL